MHNFITTKTAAKIAGYTLLALALATPAEAAGSGMPWEGPLQQVVDSITGPVARADGVPNGRFPIRPPWTSAFCLHPTG